MDKTLPMYLLLACFIALFSMFGRLMYVVFSIQFSIWREKRQFTAIDSDTRICKKCGSKQVYDPDYPIFGLVSLSGEWVKSTPFSTNPKCRCHKYGVEQ